MKTKPRSKSTRSTPARCVNPDCTTRGPEYARGLCEPCYRVLRRLVTVTKKLTWEEAENQGLCRGPKPAGSRRFPLVAAQHAKPSRVSSSSKS